MKGRKPKPTKLHVIDGTAPRKPRKNREANPAAKMPTCPNHVRGNARREWNRMSKILFRLGLLTEIDRTQLAIYCVAWGRWVEAEKKIAEYGELLKSPKGYPIHSPFLAVANKAIDQIQKSLAEFGMTPSARSRIQADKPAAAPQAAKGMADLIG